MCTHIYISDWGCNKGGGRGFCADGCSVKAVGVGVGPHQSMEDVRAPTCCCIREAEALWAVLHLQRATLQALKA
jgi:hypothetical protein